MNILNYFKIFCLLLFSKKITKSYSDTLDAIMDFFEWHGISPSRRFARQIIGEEEKTRKRIDAVIAIIKNIEKHQTQPTTVLLQSLFEEKLRQEPAELVELKFVDKVFEEHVNENTTVPKIRYERLEAKMALINADFHDLLEKVKMVKNKFGKDYLKLELTEDELIKLKRTLKNR